MKMLYFQGVRFSLKDWNLSVNPSLLSFLEDVYQGALAEQLIYKSGELQVPSIVSCHLVKGG